MDALTDQQLVDLAMAHHQAGRLNEAETICWRLLAMYPGHADILNTLGVIAYQSGRLESAQELMDQAIVADPRRAHYYNNLGLLLTDLEKFELAIAAFATALQLNPVSAEARYNLGIAHMAQGDLAAALAAYRTAIALKPDFAEAHNNLGTALLEYGDIDAAITAFSAALRYRPDSAALYQANLGNAFREQAQLDAAIEHYRRSVALDPGNAAHHSNLIYATYFHPGYDPAMIAQEHDAWHRQHANPLQQRRQAHDHEHSPERRLRLGYISPDFRDHVVGRNVLPLLREHDGENFDVVCYSDVVRRDPLTPRFRAVAGQWRDTARLTDEQLASLVREDRIDILIDMSLHMAGNRLLVFARKPAPVQVTFAGYPGTTGLETIDYRLTDPHLDPPGQHDADYTEESIRLAESFWCFDPLTDEPDVNTLPALQNGQVTFGCLNSFAKVNDSVLALWSRVLRAITEARLLILSPMGAHRERTLDCLEGLGIQRERVAFVVKQPRAEYLALHHQLDVMLDTFPYNGHTTTCDALWMGVPVVSLAGETAVSRGGLSILSNVGLPELAAQCEDDYVRIAVELARDLPRLAALRTGLRTRMLASPLMDAPRFARNIEAAYREIWRRWCARI